MMRKNLYPVRGDLVGFYIFVFSFYSIGRQLTYMCIEMRGIMVKRSFREMNCMKIVKATTTKNNLKFTQKIDKNAINPHACAS